MVEEPASGGVRISFEHRMRPWPDCSATTAEKPHDDAEVEVFGQYAVLPPSSGRLFRDLARAHGLPFTAMVPDDPPREK